MSDIANLQNITIDPAKLKALRGKKKQREIAQILGVTDQQISNIEQGIRKPSADGLLRLLLFFNVSAEDIAIEK